MIPTNNPDFNVEKADKFRDTRSFPKSGVKAGVEDGLSMVENMTRGSVEAEMKNNTTNFRQDCIVSDAGKKDGKSFEFYY